MFSDPDRMFVSGHYSVGLTHYVDILRGFFKFLFVFAFEDLESDVYSTLTAISVQTGHISDAQYPPVAWGAVLSSVLLED